MAIRNIRILGDEVLRKKSKEVKENNEKLQILVDDMFDTMYEANGVGLAAPQVGILKRLVVIDVDGTPYTLINPVIVESDGTQTGDEGCLSVPNKSGTVTRPNHVICKALDRDFNEITVEGTELLARCICHELDHLDGVVYVDKVEGDLVEVSYEEE